MHMWDHGLKLTRHCLDEAEFIKYRQILEPKYPLALALQAAGMSFLPEILERWKRVKCMIQEAIEARAPDHANPGIPILFKQDTILIHSRFTEHK